MSTQYFYAFVGFTVIVAILAGVLTFAALRFASAVRSSGRHMSEPGAETTLLSVALQEAVAKLRAQEQAMSARAEASEQLSDDIVASLTAGLLVVGDAGDVRILNPAGRKLLGLLDEQAVSQYRLLPVSAAPLVDAIEECLRTGRPIVRRALRMPESSRASHLGVTVSPLTGGKGRHGVICLFSDLRTVVKLEEQLRFKDTLAQLGELTAGIAHEFRNGLATIHGYSRLMDPQALPEGYRPYVDAIRGETESLRRVVTNFLNFAKPDQVTFSRVDLAPLVAQAVEELRHDMTRGVVTIEGEFGTIDGDDVLLRQMLVNLIRNGVDACEGSGITPAIRVRGQVDVPESAARLVVDDNGPGIEPSVRDRIFRPFFTTRAQGIGLGLAIVQKVVVTHNGRIVAGSSPLGGASFEVIFPLAEN